MTKNELEYSTVLTKGVFVGLSIWAVRRFCFVSINKRERTFYVKPFVPDRNISDEGRHRP